MTGELEIRRRIAAPREAVFDAWLDAASLREWMTPEGYRESLVETDPRPGGTFRIVMRGANEDFEHTGVYRVMDRPNRLVFTWLSQGTELQESLVTVEFHDADGDTELVLRHERLPERFAASHEDGWRGFAATLGGYLARLRDYVLEERYPVPPSVLYRLLGTPHGIRQWWTRHCDIHGVHAEFRFPENGMFIAVRVTADQPGHLLEWTPVDVPHRPDLKLYRDWIGTKIRFELQPDGEGSALRFTHQGLAARECLGVCSIEWARLLREALPRAANVP